MSTRLGRIRPWLRQSLVLAVLGLAGAGAHAGIFDDDEARRAILDLRQKIEALRRDGDQRQVDESKRQAEEIANLRRSLIDLQNQLEANRAELSKLRGQGEQLSRDIADGARRQSDALKPLDERIKRLEPITVSFEGNEFAVEVAEKRMFEAALASFRKGDFEPAQGVFADFLARYPQSGYANSAIFWLGNAQFVLKDFRSALVSFKKLGGRNPTSARAAEALLAIANCHLELKDTANARKALEELLSSYPQSEVAEVAKERLTRIK